MEDESSNVESSKPDVEMVHPLTATTTTTITTTTDGTIHRPPQEDGEIRDTSSSSKPVSIPPPNNEPQTPAMPPPRPNLRVALSMVKGDPKIDKLCQALWSNALLRRYIEVLFVLKLELLQKSDIQKPFRAQIIISFEPTNIIDFFKLWKTSAVIDVSLLQGMIQIHQILPKHSNLGDTQSDLDRRMLSHLELGALPFGSVEFICGVREPMIVNGVTLIIQEQSLYLAQQAHELEIPNNFKRGTTVKKPLSEWACIEFINALIRRHTKNQWLLRINMGPTYKPFIKDVAAPFFNHLMSSPIPGASSNTFTQAMCYKMIEESIYLTYLQAFMRRRSRKSSAGFDTTKLFIGAEGTLGIITEMIRLAPGLPTTVAVVQFPNVQKATKAVADVMNTGIGIQCVELVDVMFMSSTNRHGMSKHKWPETDSLFFKFQGPTPASLKETATIVRKIVEKHGGTRFQLARNEEEAAEFQAWPTDICVPVSKLPELLYDTKQDIANVGLISTVVGHVGDENFHAVILFKAGEEKQKAKDVVRRIVKKAISLDGTSTGKHGVGIGKKEYLVEELGEGTVYLMKTIK
ncbi:hypothetical protein D9615_010498 [Tricholomella constricta]|uniref:FAD-binding PCMH-type domain-containing protein n=1 Tax=Tricholomella constricta TaxID=117010 RepID=A0A8H5GN00_9AGAR|nr:hypothetical protein D9615_010498 [Tricholomella constricta]